MDIALLHAIEALMFNWLIVEVVQENDTMVRILDPNFHRFKVSDIDDSAGICSYQPRAGFCSVRLSEPLLKFRPREDLIDTLLVIYPQT